MSNLLDQRGAGVARVTSISGLEVTQPPIDVRNVGRKVGQANPFAPVGSPQDRPVPAVASIEGIDRRSQRVGSGIKLQRLPSDHYASLGTNGAEPGQR